MYTNVMEDLFMKKKKKNDIKLKTLQSQKVQKIQK